MRSHEIKGLYEATKQLIELRDSLRAGASGGKGLAQKPGNQSLIPGTRIKKVEETNSTRLFSNGYLHAGAQTPTQVMHTHNKREKEIDAYKMGGKNLASCIPDRLLISGMYNRLLRT